MVGNLVIRGIIVGIVAGLLAFGFSKYMGEPWVDLAIGYEDSHAQPAAPGEPEEPAIVSRDMQSGFGLMSGLVVMGAGLGGLFSIVFAFAYGRIGNLGAQQTSALLALLIWIATFFAPFLKYPANPPASSDDTTIAFRSATYLVMLAVSLAAMLGAWVLRQRLAKDYGSWYATLISAAAYIVVVVAFYVILPNINETPADFPATVLYNFRMASIGTWVIIWGALGLIFGYVVDVTLLHTQRAPKVGTSRPMMR